MSRGQLQTGLVALVVLGLAAWVWMRDSGDETRASSSLREYGALVEISGDEAPARSQQEEKKEEKQEEKKGEQEPEKEALATIEGEGAPEESVAVNRARSALPPDSRKRAVSSFRELGPFERPIDEAILTRFGFDAEEIDSIRKRYDAFTDALRGLSEDGVIRPFGRLTAEERSEIRQMRARYLRDSEYDAVLMATRRLNRAYFMGPVSPGRPAGRVGIQKGDEVLVANGIRIFESVDFADALDLRSQDEMHELVISRKQKFFDVRIRCCKMGWGGVSYRRGRLVREFDDAPSASQETELPDAVSPVPQKSETEPLETESPG